MSFLTTFPEDVYPTHSLAETIQSETFDIELAQALMWMSQAAYETTADPPAAPEKRKLERILERWGFTCRARLSQGGTEGFVAEGDRTLVVAFAGTDPVRAANWITDFNIRTGPDGTHRGFSEAVAGVGPVLIAALEGTTKHIFLVGHSLGGALAVVAAWRLTGGVQTLADWIPHGAVIDVERVAGIFAYGMPRAGDFPAFEIGSHDVPCRTNPLGIKGAGEAGAIGAPPALVNAVIDALSELGIEHLDMPLTPERLWAAIRTAAGRKAA